MYRDRYGCLKATVILLVLAEALCVAQRRQPGSTTPTASLQTYTDIQQFDFKNFVYHLKGEQITMRKGTETARNPKGEGGCSYLLETIAYGDLTSDGKDEAVVVLGCTMAPEGNGYSNEGYIYTLRKGQPGLLSEFEGGGRVASDLILGTIVAYDGTLIVVKDDGRSDPLQFQAITYKWNGRKLVEAGRSAIRK